MQDTADTAMTPAQRGYRMPAEWEPHEATWLTWPHDASHWPGIFDRIPAYWARMVKELEGGEDVHIAIHDDATEHAAKAAMKQAGVRGDRVHLHRIPNDFSWARDHGPTFLKNDAGEKLLVSWKYNAWGNKWEFRLDNEVPRAVSAITGIPLTDAPIVLEGGSIDVNGKGTLLTTESCLLHQNRNPRLTKENIERTIKDYLGVTNVLWLRDGIKGDDTDGHIDDMTRFVAPDTVVTVIEENPEDDNYAALQENLALLKTMKDQDGNPLKIITIPMPSPVLHEGERLPASYANFYIGNGVVLLTVFDDPHDADAIRVLEECFPERRVVPILARDLVWGLGAFHCVTQQQPL